MKIEIWSDIMCPFCYIGKRRLEAAIAKSGIKDIDIEWKSFQLNPQMVTEPRKNINQYLAEIKGWSLEQARSMNDRVIEMAKGEGLEYDLEKAVVANSFDAHRLIQMAKAAGKGDEAEELLFKAYFTEGSNIADHGTLILLGKSLGFSGPDLEAMLSSNRFAEEVRNDIAESRKIGVSGVPFFVFNRQYAVSGAQETEIFLDVLNKAAKNEA
ncbi:MAG TPA: DsbA family oxidoreductase [Bacteroidia bacterium]|jgi:predicted DsbA family dithiol-disulfide isomerase